MLTARRFAAPALLVLTLALTYLATAATARAMPAPPPETYANQPPASGGLSGENGGPGAPPVTTVVNHTGSAVWTYVVVAIAAAVLTLALAWTLARLRHAHNTTAHAPAT
jgi:hypothetical protein